MPARVDFRRTRYGRELLIDTAWVRELPTFLRDDSHALTFHDILLVTPGRGWFRAICTRSACGTSAGAPSR